MVAAIQMAQRKQLDARKRSSGASHFERALRDKVIPPELADRMIAAMGGAQAVDLDAGHRSYDTHPDELAAVIDECCANVV